MTKDQEIEKQEGALVEMPEVDKIFYSLTPRQKIKKASEMAKELQDVVKQAKLARNFGGKKDHLEYEAWQTIGQFFAATPATEWTKPIVENDEIVGWEARVNVLNAEGRIIGTAEGMCMRDEKNWQYKPNYQLRSMAQTRTASKALRSVFAFVAVLAGYEATPAEEMDQQLFTEDGQVLDEEVVRRDLWALLGKKIKKEDAKKCREFIEEGARVQRKKSVTLMVELIESFERDNREIAAFAEKFKQWMKAGGKGQGELF